MTNSDRSSRRLSLYRLVASAVFLALAIVLPFLTGQLQSIGSMLCPMHIPVLLCGFVCGWKFGLTVGAISPILRSLLFGMPPFYPTAVAMAFELAVYGAVSGILYRLFPKKIGYIYLSLVISMVAGRVVWGIARAIMAGISNTEFTFSAFLSGAITTALPGIILQLVLIPPIVRALRDSRLMLNK